MKICRIFALLFYKRWFKEGWVSGLNQQFAKLPIS